MCVCRLGSHRGCYCVCVCGCFNREIKMIFATMSIALLPDLMNVIYVCIFSTDASGQMSRLSLRQRTDSAPRRNTILTRLCLPLLFSPPPRPLCFHQTTKSVKFREITQLLSHSVFRLVYPGVTHSFLMNKGLTVQL